MAKFENFNTKDVTVNVQQNVNPAPASVTNPNKKGFFQDRKNGTWILLAIMFFGGITGQMITKALFDSGSNNNSSNSGSFDYSSYDDSNTTEPIYEPNICNECNFATNFTAGGSLANNTDICAGDFKYTVNGTGSIISPNYPANYGANSSCTNQIETASDGITFEINGFNLETNNDQVVFRGANEDWIYTGKSSTGDRFSFPDSFVDVYFMSDNEYEYSGFKISVIDGFEQANNIVTTYDTRITKNEDLPNFNENSQNTE